MEASFPQEGLGPSLVNGWGGRPSKNYHFLTFPSRDAIDGEDYSRFQKDAINNAGTDITLTEYLTLTEYFRMTRVFFKFGQWPGRPAIKNYHSLTFPLRDAIDGEYYSRFQRDAINNFN